MAAKIAVKADWDTCNACAFVNQQDSTDSSCEDTPAKPPFREALLWIRHGLDNACCRTGSSGCILDTQQSSQNDP